MSRPGLRELKREATAQALAEAAFDLARERGLDGFTIDDVTDRAGYSRRTFANHYSCKEEAVASVAFQDVEEAAAALAETSPDVPLLDAVQEVLQRQLTGEALRRMRQVLELADRHPSLEPHVLSVQHRMRLAAQQLIHSIAGDRYEPAYVALLFGAVFGMVTAAFEDPLQVRLPGEPGNGLDFPAFLDLAFDHLRTGF